MIYLVRHGQTDWNIEKRTQGHTDIPLNDNGKQQAQIISEKLKYLKIDKIYSSDLLRSKETAEIINQNFNLEIIFDKRLREINYGDLEGIPRTELNKKTWEIFNKNPEKLHAEPIIEVYNRIKSFFEEIETDKNILIVAHGGALRVIMYYINNKEIFNKEEYDKTFKDTKIKNADVFEWDSVNNKLNTLIV